MTFDVPMACRTAATKMNQPIAATQLEVELHVIWHSYLSIMSSNVGEVAAKKKCKLKC
jgi:hypothetical protein